MSKENTNTELDEKKEAKAFQKEMAAEFDRMKKELRAEIEAEIKAKIKAESSTVSDTEQRSADKQVKDMVIGMKAKLEARPKVKIKIPIDKLNPKDTTCFAQINGYTYTIKRGEEVEVPDVVKKLLERAGTI